MEKNAPSLSLPNHLLELADAKGLVVEGGAVLFESEIGGDLISHNWLTQQESGVCVSTEILSPVTGAKDEYEELLPASMSEPLKDEQAAAVIERWGQLKHLEVSFDAQMVQTRQRGKVHDSDMANDNI